MRALKVLSIFTILLLASGYAIAEKASLGFSTKVTGEGSFFNTKIKQAIVVKVNPGSPADKAGLQVKDDLISLNGKTLAGQTSMSVGSFMNSVKPGDHLIVVVKRPDGSIKTLTIVAGSQPK